MEQNGQTGKVAVDQSCTEDGSRKPLYNSPSRGHLRKEETLEDWKLHGEEQLRRNGNL